MHCIVCDRGIRKPNDEGRLLCQEHTRSLAKLEFDEQPIKLKSSDAWKWIKYRGHVVMLKLVKGKIKATYLGMSTAEVPKRKLVDLDVFCPSLDRKTVKQLKRIVLSVSCI